MTVSFISQNETFLVVSLDKIVAIFEPAPSADKKGYITDIHLISNEKYRIESEYESLGSELRNLMENPESKDDAFHVISIEYIPTRYYEAPL